MVIIVISVIASDCVVRAVSEFSAEQLLLVSELTALKVGQIHFIWVLFLFFNVISARVS